MRRCAREAADKAIKWGITALHKAETADRDRKRKEWIAIFDKSGGSISADEALALYHGTPGRESSGCPAENEDKVDPDHSDGDCATDKSDDSTQGEHEARNQIVEE
jgi:hypothetical protein